MKQKHFFECGYNYPNIDKTSCMKTCYGVILVQADDFKSAMEKFYEIARSGDIGEQVKLQSISESNMVIYVD